MQTQLTQPTAADPLRHGAQQVTAAVADRGQDRCNSGLARSAAAAVELPFSALFYWVD